MKTPSDKNIISLSERLKNSARQANTHETLSQIGWSKDLAVILTTLQSHFDDLHGTWCPGNLGNVTDNLEQVRSEYLPQAQQMMTKIDEALTDEKHDLEITNDGDIVLSWRHRTCTYIWTP